VLRRLDEATIAGRDLVHIDADISQADDAIEVRIEGAVVARLTHAGTGFTLRSLSSRLAALARSAGEASRMVKAHMEALAEQVLGADRNDAKV
jgi:hypothetical protein